MRLIIFLTLACWLVAEWRCTTIDVRVISFHPVPLIAGLLGAAVTQLRGGRQFILLFCLGIPENKYISTDRISRKDKIHL